MGAANYNTQDASFATGGALVEDTLFMRAAGRLSRTDGFFKSSIDGAKDMSKDRDIDGRVSLRWIPTRKWDVTLAADVQDYDGNYADFALLDGIKDNPHEVDSDWKGDAGKNACGTSLRASYDMDSMRLMSITAYRSEDSVMDNDLDFTAFDVMRMYIDKDDDLASQEFRFHSTDDTSPLQWLAGAYLFHEAENQVIRMEMRPMSGMAGTWRTSGDIKATGGALFGQASYTFWDKLEVTAGLRYDRESKICDYEWRGGAFMGIGDFAGSSRKLFQAWLPKFALNYRFTDDISSYLSVSRGFKSGGFNIKSAPGEPFDSEYTWSYEAGLKSSWFDKRLQVNLAGFVIKWDDMQVELPDYPDYKVVNAAAATSTGFEFEMKARPIQGLEVIAGTGLTHAVFDSFKRNGNNLKDNRVPNVPGFTANIGATYRFDNGLFLGADYMRTGSMYLNAENERKQGAYQTVNAKLGYEDENYEVYAWGKNLFNAVYATRSFKMTSNNEWYGRAGDPLTFGLSGAIRF